MAFSRERDLWTEDNRPRVSMLKSPDFKTNTEVILYPSSMPCRTGARGDICPRVQHFGGAKCR